MDKANVAEWILRRVVNPERASELVGDRLEVSSTGGPLRFWLYIAWLVFVFSWRTLAGFIAAVVVGIGLAFLPVFAWQRNLNFDFSELSLHARVTLMIFAMHSTLLWAEAGFCIVRFGPRNELSRLSVITALLCSITAGYGWLPHAPAILLLATVCVVSFYLTSTMRRQTLGVWIVALMSAWIAVYALTQIQRVFLKSPPYIFLGTATVLVPIVLGGVSLSLLRRSSAYELAGLG